MTGIRRRASPWAACRSLVGLLLAVVARAWPAPAMAQSPAPVTVGAEPRSTDTVRVGCFGGHAASSSGNVLDRAGALSSYEKQLQTPATYSFLRRDSAVAALVFAELERIRFRTMRVNAISNMTCFLELSDSEGEHEVTWLMGRPPAELHPVLAALTRTFGNHGAMWARGI